MSGLIKDCNSLPPSAPASACLTAWLLCLGEFVFQSHRFSLSDFFAVVLAVNTCFWLKTSLRANTLDVASHGMSIETKGRTYNVSKYPSVVCIACNIHIAVFSPEMFASGFHVCKWWGEVSLWKTLPITHHVSVCNSQGILLSHKCIRKVSVMSLTRKATLQPE